MGIDEYIETFLAEARDLIDDVEPHLISMKNAAAAADAESLNAVFRLFHSLKGNAGMLQLGQVQSVTHEAETLLDAVRKGRMRLQDKHITVLCEAIDCLRSLLSRIAETGSDSGSDDLVKHTVASIRAELDTANSTANQQVVGKPEAAAIALLAEKQPPDAPSLITPEIAKNFVQEACELLDVFEEAMLQVEGDISSRPARIQEAFRAIHSLKGNAGFMGLVDLERLCHAMESLLSAYRDNRAAHISEAADMLLQLVDVLRGAVADVGKGGKGEIPSCDVYAQLLQESMPAAASDSTSAPSPAVAVASNLKVTSSPLPAETAPAEAAPKQRLEAQRRDIRVDLEKLDRLLNLVGELVIAESMVASHARLKAGEDESLERALHQLGRVSTDLQDVAMSLRMVPLAGAFRKMIRLVHDLSHKANKEVNLELRGEETEVDKTVIELISDPLVHIVRNAVDHGIEPSAERAAAGKPRTGTLILEAKHESGEVWIMIRDDGRGLQRDKILAKAQAQGLIKGDGRELKDEQVFSLIFLPGFSTAEKVTDVSGRGVGMDVVKKNIEDKLKGKVELKSSPGKGTTVLLRIPLTLAIIDGMLVRVGQSLYTIPLLSIRETFRPSAAQISRTPDGGEIIRVRDDLIPVIRLHRVFGIKNSIASLEAGILLVVEDNNRLAALFIDDILGQQQTVIKGLSGFFGRVSGISGCTILGDGQVSLILDVGGILTKAGIS